MEALVIENDPEKFTGSGMPKTGVVAAIVGFPIDAGERNAVWEEVSTPDEG
jgi:hypothetical protein